ncbi:MAG: tyrosine-type recombinase/integrase, partial [Phycisphaerales bacterium]|nr:tyrosine-type recombinase/integrase [Phycisphaerales bacterium]
RLANRLADCGLIPRESRPDVPDMLGAFLSHYIAGRTDTKQGTRVMYRQVRRRLVAYFGEDRRLTDIAPGEAKQWRRHLLQTGLAENTVRRSCGMARQFLREAVELKAIPSNPFDVPGLPVTVHGNPDRFHFVEPATIARVIEACPDAEWRLLVGLARYGGLRVPSEVVRLRWGDIDWAAERMTITSPKTEHHVGRGSRVMPIFRELRPLLADAFDAAPEGSEHVIQRYRSASQNLRTQLGKIIRRAGVEPWPRLWQNLRSSRETELADQFPIHVVTAWLGNSPKVALAHYLQVTDDHMRSATECATVPGCTDLIRDADASDDKGTSGVAAERCNPLHLQGVTEQWAGPDSTATAARRDRRGRALLA